MTNPESACCENIRISRLFIIVNLSNCRLGTPDRCAHRTTLRSRRCDSEAMKLEFLKTDIGLVVLCAAILTVPLAGSAQTTPGGPSTETATTEQRTHRDHRSNYGLIGLLGLLGLAGLGRRKQDVRPQERTNDRRPAAPGNYVSDLKTEKRTKPE